LHQKHAFTKMLPVFLSQILYLTFVILWKVLLGCNIKCNKLVTKLTNWPSNLPFFTLYWKDGTTDGERGGSLTF